MEKIQQKKNYKSPPIHQRNSNNIIQYLNYYQTQGISNNNHNIYENYEDINNLNNIDEDNHHQNNFHGTMKIKNDINKLINSG